MSLTIDRTKKIHEQITKETWHQGYYYKDNPRPEIGGKVEVCALCLMGWIIDVYRSRSCPRTESIWAIDYAATDDDKQLAVSVVTKLKNKINYYSVPAWNDNPKRTFEEVHAVLKELDI
jgi:hypothetical protein